MRILIVSQCFYPESFRINDIAKEWIKRGYEVTVLTGIPNYPEGRFFPGYSWTKKRHEKWENIDIVRIPIIARGRNFIGLILNYFSFVISGWFWNRFTKVEADLVFSFETSPMTQVKVGCGYAKKHKVPHILYVQDLWPENVEIITGIYNRLVIGPIDRMVDKIYRQVNTILVTSPSFISAVVNRKKRVKSEKVYYWPQYAEDFYIPLEKQQVPDIPDDGSFKIAFTGNIGNAQGLDILPKTAQLLKGKDIKFVIVGDGRYLSELTRQIRDLDVREKFIFVPRVPAERIPVLLSVCDACFISFAKSPLWEMTIPAKLQSYMACGKPIIASASGETKRIIEESKCGICTEIGDEKELFRGITEIMKMDLSVLGKNSRSYFEKCFYKKNLMDEMDGFITNSLKCGF